MRRLGKNIQKFEVADLAQQKVTFLPQNRFQNLTGRQYDF